MHRREVLQKIIIGAGAIWLLPSCMRNSADTAAADAPLANDDQLALLAGLVDTVIPETDTPGAKALNVHHFVLVMVHDCRTEEYKAGFMGGLDQLENYSQQKNGKSFLASNYPERLSLLKGVSKDKAATQEIRTLVSGVRELTIRGYANSEYVMTEQVPYQLVPGHFLGCVPAKKGVS